MNRKHLAKQKVRIAEIEDKLSFLDPTNSFEVGQIYVLQREFENIKREVATEILRLKGSHLTLLKGGKE